MQSVDFKLPWSADKLFTMQLTEIIIETGQSIEFSVTFEKAVIDNIRGKAAYVKVYIVGESKDFIINLDGYETELKLQLAEDKTVFTFNKNNISLQ